MKDFAYWRVDVAATDTATGPARAGRFARDRQLREMLILRDLGVWSHYVADASNPMHTTIHSDGWGDHLNPSGYSTERGLHTRFEATFVNANIDTAEVLKRMPVPTTCDRSIMDRVRTYIGSSNAQVIALYELERQGASKGPNEPGEDFVAARMAAAVAEIRDLVVMAWNASESAEVGFPSVTVSDVIGGDDPTVALFGRE